MFKIFEVLYNNGGWLSGDLPHFFYIAETEEEISAKSEKFQEFLKWKQEFGGNIWCKEVTGLPPALVIENASDFNITVTVKKKKK